MLLIIASVTAPHVMVEAATVVPGRSLIPASRFFLTASPDGEGFAGAVEPDAVGFGISVTYLGLALQQVGALIGIGTFWVLIAEDVGRWVRRFAMASGIFLLLGSATVVLGYQQLVSAGVPTLARRRLAADAAGRADHDDRRPGRQASTGQHLVPGEPGDLPALILI